MGASFHSIRPLPSRPMEQIQEQDQIVMQIVALERSRLSVCSSVRAGSAVGDVIPTPLVDRGCATTSGASRLFKLTQPGGISRRDRLPWQGMHWRSRSKRSDQAGMFARQRFLILRECWATLLVRFYILCIDLFLRGCSEDCAWMKQSHDRVPETQNRHQQVYWF